MPKSDKSETSIPVSAGRPPHEPTGETRDRVEMLAAFGIPAQDIAATLEITDTTLRKYYRHELDTGLVKANEKVAGALFKNATGNDPKAVSAAIFWLKTRARWRDVNPVEVSGPNGGPLQSVDLTNMTEEEIAVLLEAAKITQKKDD